MKKVLSWPVKYIWTVEIDHYGREYTKEYTFRLRKSKAWAKGNTLFTIEQTRNSQGERIILAP